MLRCLAFQITFNMNLTTARQNLGHMPSYIYNLSLWFFGPQVSTENFWKKALLYTSSFPDLYLVHTYIKIAHLWITTIIYMRRELRNIIHNTLKENSIRNYSFQITIVMPQQINTSKDYTLRLVVSLMKSQFLSTLKD